MSIVAALTAISTFGILRLEITSDNRSFFGDSDPRFAELTRFEEQFAPYSTVVFVITSRIPIANSVDHQSAHAFASKAVRELPFVARVDSLTNYPVVRGIEDSIEVSPLLNANCHEGSCTLLQESLSDHIIVNRIISRDQTTSAIIASFALKVGESSEVSEVTDAIDHYFRPMFEERYPDLQLHITGGVPMMQAFVTATERDMATLFPFAGITLLVILAIVLGGAYLTLVMISLGAITCLITLGMAGWSGLVLNSATSTIPIVIFALTIASTMHLFLHLARGRAIHGSEMLPTAFRSALRAHTVPIVMTLATTAIGMLSLINVPSPPVKELGIWVASGLVVGGILTFTALPAVLSFRLTLTESAFAITLQQLLNHYARRLETNSFPRYPFVIFFFLSLIGLSTLKIDDDFVKYFDSSSRFRVETEFAQEVLAGPYGIEIVLSEGERTDIFNPEFFSHLESLTKFLSEDERVIHAVSIYDILKSVQQDIQPSKTGVSEESPEYLSQLFLAYNLSLQKDQSTTDYVSFDHLSARISVLLQPSTSSEIRQFTETIEAWEKTNKRSNIVMIITGESVPTAFLSPTNITAMITGIVFSLVCSAGVIGLYYQSLRIGMIALVSIVVPVLIGFGLWGWLYGSIGLATTVIVAITIGVVIDDSIHMIVRAKDGQSNLSLEPSAAAAYSVYRVGIAIVGTTLVLVGAFSLLLFSGFELNSAFGLCTTLILIAALLFDLFFLPTLITWALKSDSSNEVT